MCAGALSELPPRCSGPTRLLYWSISEQKQQLPLPANEWRETRLPFDSDRWQDIRDHEHPLCWGWRSTRLQPETHIRGIGVVNITRFEVQPWQLPTENGQLAGQDQQCVRSELRRRWAGWRIAKGLGCEPGKLQRPCRTHSLSCRSTNRRTGQCRSTTLIIQIV